MNLFDRVPYCKTGAIWQASTSNAPTLVTPMSSLVQFIFLAQQSIFSSVFYILFQVSKSYAAQWELQQVLRKKLYHWLLIMIELLNVKLWYKHKYLLLSQLLSKITNHKRDLQATFDLLTFHQSKNCTLLIASYLTKGSNISLSSDWFNKKYGEREQSLS